MQRVFVIGHNDLRRFLKNRASSLWLFAVPILFMYFMGYASRAPGSASNPRPRVVVENQDPRFLSAVFLDELGVQGLVLLDASRAKEAAGEIRVPEDFTARVLAGHPAKVEFNESDNSSSGLGTMVKLRLIRAMIAMNSHVIAAAGTRQPITEESLRAAQQEAPAVTLEARFAGRKPVPTGFNFSVPGVIVMYVMMNLLIFGGATLSAERRYGIIRRLAMHPISRGVLVGGKIYGLLLLGTVQIAVFLAAGKWLFHVNLGANLPGVVLTLLVFAWVAASLGVCLGSVVRGEDKIVGLCILVSLLMAALGGCWWPLEIVPPWLKVAAHCVPSGWALDALHQLISLGGTLPDCVRPLLVLGGFGAASNWLAARFFRW